MPFTILRREITPDREWLETGIEADTLACSKVYAEKIMQDVVKFDLEYSQKQYATGMRTTAADVETCIEAVMAIGNKAAAHIICDYNKDDGRMLQTVARQVINYSPRYGAVPENLQSKAGLRPCESCVFRHDPEEL